MTPDTESALAAAARRLRATRLLDLFARDPQRVEALTLQWNDWRVDFAKERIDADTLTALLAHAQRANLDQWIRALFAGEKLNQSESRPVLHPLLRQPDPSLVVDGEDVGAAMRATRDRVGALAGAVRAGRRVGASGRPLRAVVNLGIGGS